MQGCGLHAAGSVARAHLGRVLAVIVVGLLCVLASAGSASAADTTHRHGMRVVEATYSITFRGQAQVPGPTALRGNCRRAYRMVGYTWQFDGARRGVGLPVTTAVPGRTGVRLVVDDDQATGSERLTLRLSCLRRSTLVGGGAGGENQQRQGPRPGKR
ncbi:MAG: hypothetical protein ACR2NA_09210 [Solirubrobacterales bacterium]